MATLKVNGHKGPDTDTTCSAIVYAWHLTENMGKKAEAFVLGELNKETEFVLNKFGVKKPSLLKKYEKGDELVIVDTNNAEELLDNLNEASVVEILDHHKLTGNISTEVPIPVTIEPLACTATIIWKKIKEANVSVPPKEMVGLMLSAILSDTLKFTSPTTTDEDKEAARELSKICGEDIESLSESMFEAKSDLTGMSAMDILLVDSKLFETKGKKVRYSVLETTNPEKALEMQKEIEEASNKLKEEESLDYLFFFVIDILNSDCVLLVTKDEERKVAAKAFDKKFEEKLLKLPGIVSRKKQIIPSIEAVL